MKKRSRKSQKSSRGRRETLRTYGDWVRVAVAPNALVAGMMEGALRNKGILVLEKKFPFDFPTCPTGDRAIMVPAERAEEARMVLEGIWDIEERG